MRQMPSADLILGAEFFRKRIPTLAQERFLFAIDWMTKGVPACGPGRSTRKRVHGSWSRIAARLFQCERFLHARRDARPSDGMRLRSAPSKTVKFRFLPCLFAFLGAVSGVFAQTTTIGSEEKAVFAGGCFWCMQPPFDHVPGVTATL